MTVSNPQKWFFGGVLTVILINVIAPDKEFAAIVFFCCATAAVVSFMCENDRQDKANMKSDEDE